MCKTIFVKLGWSKIVLYGKILGRNLLDKNEVNSVNSLAVYQGGIVHCLVFKTHIFAISIDLF